MAVLKKLFEPLKVGNIELRNRIVMLGMGLGFGERFRPNDRLIAFFGERAAGGVGLIIVGSLFPADFDEVAFTYTPAGLSLGIWDDSFIPKLKVLTEDVHKHGAKIAAQLSLNYEWRADRSHPLEVVGPSGGLEITRSLITRELNRDEIKQIVEQFGEAARRARETGFDAVEFHFGNGFLVNQFMSPRTNKRTDEYGGSLENRLRFPLEIIDCAKRKAGDDYTLMCRVSGDEMMEGGLKLEDTKEMVIRLERAGVAAINAQAGTEQSPIPLIQQWVPPGAFVYIAEEFKEVIKIPVVAAYRIKDPFLAEEIVAKGRADLVGMARALLADPEWPNKAREGRFDDIRPCISCCRCLDDIMEAKPISCSVNARLGKEVDCPAYQPAPTRKKVLVIGGGPAGIEAARVAVLRGHAVSLHEKGPRLGGALILASIVNRELEGLVKYMRREVGKLPIQVITGKELTAELIGSINPDVVILATGEAAQEVGKLPGKRVLTSHDILGIVRDNTIPRDGLRERLFWKAGAVLFRYFYSPFLIRWFLKFSFPFGEKVTIIGGGLAGCELADFLAERHKRVTVVGESTRVGEGIGPTTRWVVRRRLRQGGVRMIERARVEEITETGVTVSHEDTTEILKSDTLVLARQVQPSRELEGELRGKVPAIFSIGDCVEPAQVKEAIAQGFKVGMEV